MTARSGLAATLGFGDESVWGTPVTPTVFHPFVSESLAMEIERFNSESIIPGARVLRSTQWNPGTVSVSGDVQLELPDQDTGLLLKHMMGGSSTTDGNFTPADLPAGLTIQVGRPNSTDGTVVPYTYSGCKVSSWEIAFEEGQNCTLGLDFLGKHEIGHRSVTDGVTTNASAAITSATAVFDESDVGKPITGTNIPASTTIASVTSATAATLSANATGSGTGITFTIGVAATSPTYTSGLGYFSYYEATVTLAGSSFKVKSGTLAGNNTLADDRGFVGQRHRDEPLENGIREYTGTLDTEFFSDVAYRRFVTGTEAALVVTFTKGARSLTATCNVRFDGTTPNVGDRGIVQQSLPFTCVGPTTDAGALTFALDTAG